MTMKRPELARARRAAGYTQELLAEHVGVSPQTVRNWESGRAEPLAYKRPKLARVIGISLTRLETLLKNAPLEPGNWNCSTVPSNIAIADSVPIGEIPLDTQYVESLHSRIQELVRMDMQFGGDLSSGVALKLFQSVHRKLGQVKYDQAIEADLYSAAGELGELTGWLLFDAGKHDLVRRVNNEALNLLRMAGDRSTEILTLQNMSMHAGYLKRPAEALRLSQMVLEQNNLSPRLRALFLIRKARALALGGNNSEAKRTFDQAASLYLDGVRDNDPGWAWWINDEEIAWHEAMIYGDIGERYRSIDILQECVDLTPVNAVRGRYVHTASLLEAQTHAQAWAEISNTFERLMPYVDEVGSTRAATMLLKTIPIIEKSATASGDVRSNAAELKRRLIDAGYFQEDE
ncbi:helix-turn-helix domain-containing protein [Amycolatopsis albispora]|uniref:helix-turn-helix domain-containing protein n=1 Tax=Amycolatopsis albispora TaxID=1804986 RepID=UPI0013B3D8DF|nr:helix-turn-helix transcriptional regulator [Amycolatopsis albispora]